MSARRFTDRKAIVTGGATGIGFATAKRLADEGAEVLLVGRTAASLEKATAAIARRNGKAWFYVADVSRSAESADAVAEAVGRWGRIDVLVNNAAISAEGEFTEMPDETWDSVIATNLTGAFFMARSVAREMIRPGRGVILNTASVDAHGGERLHANYNASKAGLVAMTRTMAVELAQHGIRANVVSPGWTYVDSYRDWCDPELLTYLQTTFDRVPMKRLVRAEEVAAVFAFLASDDASAITGQNITVDCGLTANLYTQETWPIAPNLSLLPEGT